MALFKIRMADAFVQNLKDLKALWQLHGGPRTLLGRVVFTGELSDEEFLSLPEGLRKLIVFEDQCEEQDDSAVFLDRLFNLDDPRDKDPRP
jgi:hypothetical protein